MTFVAVGEIIIDAFFFHQAGDEPEVAFVVLHAIGPFLPRFAEARVIDVRNARLLEHGFDNLEDVLILIDREVAVVGQEIGPRAQGEPIVKALAAFLRELAIRDQAVEIPLQLIVLADADPGRFPEVRQQLDLSERRDNVQGNQERSAQRFDRLDPFEDYLLSAEIDPERGLSTQLLEHTRPPRRTTRSLARSIYERRSCAIRSVAATRLLD